MKQNLKERPQGKESNERENNRDQQQNRQQEQTHGKHDKQQDQNRQQNQSRQLDQNKQQEQTHGKHAQHLKQHDHEKQQDQSRQLDRPQGSKPQQKAKFVDKTSQADKEKFMRRAIELSEKASLIEKSGGVFGAVIVKDGKIIAEGYNQVIKQNDPTWHGEMHAIREACKKLKSPHLKGCTLYSSAECCPMCLCTAYWANLDHIYIGATIQDAKKYGNFDDEHYLAELRKDPKDREIQFTQMLRDEALEVWKKFHDMPNRQHY
jgi:guanine deaminase